MLQKIPMNFLQFFACNTLFISCNTFQTYCQKNPCAIRLHWIFSKNINEYVLYIEISSLLQFSFVGEVRWYSYVGNCFKKSFIFLSKNVNLWTFVFMEFGIRCWLPWTAYIFTIVLQTKMINDLNLFLHFLWNKSGYVCNKRSWYHVNYNAKADIQYRKMTWVCECLSWQQPGWHDSFA